MERKKHAVLDHPIIGYFILMFFGLIFMSIFSFIDIIIAGILPGYGKESVTEIMGQEIKTVTAIGIGNAIGSLVALLIFYLMFRSEYKGVLKKQYLLKGLLLLAPFLLLHYAGSVVSIATLGSGSILIAFLRAFAPGFCEEISFRGMGVANYMRTIKEEKKIWVIFWLSSLVFGFSHMTNSAGGASVAVSLIQSVYAVGVGMLFAAVYIRTGNLWPSIIGHMSVDFVEFIRKDLSESTGIMQELGVGDWITIVAGLLAGVYAIILLNRKHFPEIMELWRDKWAVK